MTVTFFSIKDGLTALHIAIIKSNIMIIRLLINNGIDINLQEKVRHR